MVGHKMYAPKGIAALYVRTGVVLEPVIYGGGQERGLRAGTENVALIAALGAAPELARHDLAGGAEARLAGLRDRLHARLAAAPPGRAELNGPPDRRLPNTLNISITGLRGHELLAATPGRRRLHRIGVHQRPAHTLACADRDGPGRGPRPGRLRLSLGRWSSQADIDSAAGQLAGAAIRLAGPPAGRTAPAGEHTMTPTAGRTPVI